jgi:predicted lipoprotein with Yx(FWY)xxD motif
MLRISASNPKAHPHGRALSLLLATSVCLAILVAPAGARSHASGGSALDKRAAHTRTVAKKAGNSTLGETVLTNLKGRTLYTLSAEVKGRFICTGACLSIWHPLVVPKDVKPLGPTRLGVVKRPDGRTQVTFKGRPLYSFGGDAKPGDANGQGVKDVGTWHAASLGKLTANAEPQPPENPYPY